MQVKLNNERKLTKGYNIKINGFAMSKNSKRQDFQNE